MSQEESLTAPVPAVQAFRCTIKAGCVLTMVSSIRSFMVDRPTLPSFFSPQIKRKHRNVITRQIHFLLIQLQLPLKPLHGLSPSNTFLYTLPLSCMPPPQCLSVAVIAADKYNLHEQDKLTFYICSPSITNLDNKAFRVCHIITAS